MKKIALCTVVALFMALSTVQSQTAFPDGGFENCWKEYQTLEGKSYWDFNSNYFLSTLNTLYDMTTEQGIAPLTAWRLTGSDVYNGNYSLKVASDEMIMGDEMLFLPGVAGTLYVDIFNVDCILGKPFTSRPTNLKGYFKYAPEKGDSAAIEVFLKKEGFVLGKGKRVIKETVSDWSQFDIPIAYEYEMTPDTIVVLFVSSAKYDFSSINTLLQCKGQIGSTLCLDDVEFAYGPSGIKEMFTPSISVNVYPNPSTEQITIQIGKETNGTVKIYDYLSRKVGEYSVNGTQTTINISDFATGSYLINIVENGKIITTGRFLKQ